MAAVHVARAQAHCVLPETLAPFRARIDETLLEALLALPAAAAMDVGVVSPAPLVVDIFPRAHGSQRVKEAATR